MANFQVLTGKTLKSKIAGFGKKAATFAADLHQLAYSALNHVEEHHDAVYVTALYNAMPTNYRLSVVKWSTALGKVTFDPKTLEFSYAKGKTSDMVKAMAVSPAEFSRETKAGERKVAALIDRVDATAKKAVADPAASGDDIAFAKALSNFVQAYKASLIKSAESVKQTAPRKPRLIKTSKPEADAPEVAKAA